MNDLIRELLKALDVLKQCERHFSAEAEMNAALHLSENVRPSPLSASVSTEVAQLEAVIAHYSNPEAVEALDRGLKDANEGNITSHSLRSHDT